MEATKKATAANDAATRPETATPAAKSPMEEKTEAFIADAIAGAQAVLPSGESVAKSVDGFVVLTIRAVLPVNVAAALEWGDESNVSYFANEALELSAECDLMDEDCLPSAVREQLRLPAGKYVDFDRWLAFPYCRAGFAVPSRAEVKKAFSSIVRRFTPMTEEQRQGIARLLARA